MRVAGVDGCRGGWVIAHLEAGRVVFEIVPEFRAVLSATRDADMVAVDMPIGLPERVGLGGRCPDAAARHVLGKRSSSVFSIPARAAVYGADYDAARAIALKHSDPPRSVAKQCYCIFPKVREIDALLTPALQARVVETHPEVAFWAMNDETSLALPKRVKSKPFPEGLTLRRTLLAKAGVGLGDFAVQRGIVAEDDFIDAAACAVAARRVAQGVARRFPDDPRHDARGLRMEIWA